jgi:DNA invertase Pin-like site-specific DNA recombinase
MRKSSVRDLTKDLSPETQEREVRDLAARYGDEADLVMLADWDISGRDKATKKRTQYMRLKEAVESGECRVVYSYSLSRLARSVKELSELFELCKRRGVPIRMKVDNVDVTTASGRANATMLGVMAQFEADVAAERVKAMYATKRERAIAEGNDPVEAVRVSRRYGERKTVIDRTTMQPVERGEGEDADRVLAIFREVGSYTRTARRLNEEGAPARNGKKWWASSVKVVVERLDPELRATPGVKGSPRGRSEFKLAKLLRCPMDGATLTGSRIPDKKGKRWTRYSCRHGEATPHPKVSIAEHLIMPAIEDEAALFRDPSERTGPSDAEARRAELTARRQRVAEARVDGLITREDASRQAAEIDAELARLSAPPQRDLRILDAMSVEEVNKILRQLFERIELDPATFHPRPDGFVWRDPSWREDP